MQLADNLDLSFIHRVYRTTLILLAVTTPLVWARFHVQAASGWLIGALINLGIVASVEWSVRQYFRVAAGQGSGGKMVGLYFLKVLLTGALMLGAFILRKNGWLSFRWLLFGFPLPLLVVILKFVGLQVRAATSGPLPGAGVAPRGERDSSDAGAPPR